MLNPKDIVYINLYKDEKIIFHHVAEASFIEMPYLEAIIKMKECLHGLIPEATLAEDIALYLSLESADCGLAYETCLGDIYLHVERLPHTKADLHHKEEAIKVGNRKKASETRARHKNSKARVVF